MNGASSNRGAVTGATARRPPGLSGRPARGRSAGGAASPTAGGVDADAGAVGAAMAPSLGEEGPPPMARDPVAAERPGAYNRGFPFAGEGRSEVGVDAELHDEQEFVDLAYARLDAMRDDANAMLEGVLDLGRGGTFQSRTERDVIVRTSLARLEQLDIGDQALTFGRIDRLDRRRPGRRGGQRRRPETSRRSTSAGWPSTAPTTIRWWSTGGPRSPSRSTGPPAATPWAWCSGATWPSRDGGWSASRTSASTRSGRRGGGPGGGPDGAGGRPVTAPRGS